MYDHVKANINKSLGLIAANPKFPETCVEVIDSRPGKKPVDLKADFPFLNISYKTKPWYFMDGKGALACKQQEFYGFWVVKLLLKCILVAARCIQAGSLLENNEFFAASVNLYYSGALQMLRGYLAAYGRVLEDSPSGTPVVTLQEDMTGIGFSALNPPRQMLAGILNAEGVWHFEGRARTHSRLWKELDLLFEELDGFIPDYFHDLFDYLLSYGPDVIDNDPETRVKTALQYLIDSRHESIYGHYGFDDFAFDALTNGELITAPLGLKAKRYGSFVNSLMSELIEDYYEIKSNNVAVWKDIYPVLRFAVIAQPFELPIPNLPGLTKDNKEKITEIFSEIFTGPT